MVWVDSYYDGAGVMASVMMARYWSTPRQGRPLKVLLMVVGVAAAFLPFCGFNIVLRPLRGLRGGLARCFVCLCCVRRQDLLRGRRWKSTCV